MIEYVYCSATTYERIFLSSSSMYDHRHYGADAHFINIHIYATNVLIITLFTRLRY